jgi:hypothetical protein
LLLEGFPCFLGVSSDSQLEHAEVFDAECFLKVALRGNGDKFILVVQVVKFDWPDFGEVVAEGFPGLEGQ